MKNKNMIKILCILLILIGILTCIIILKIQSQKIDYTEYLGYRTLERCDLVDFRQIKINNQWVECKNIKWDIVIYNQLNLNGGK